MEQIDHVIIEHGSMCIYATSNHGRQVRVQFQNPYEFMQGIQKCSSWLPSERILNR